MTPPTAAPRPLHRPPRSGVLVFRPRRRAPALTRLGVAFALILMLLLGGLTAALTVRADDEEPARYTPTSRGDRIAATEAVQRWRPLVSQYPWDVELALRVIGCESEGDPSVWNRQGSGAHGLFQTMPQWRALAYVLTEDSDLANPVVNAAVAFFLWRDSGGTFRWHWGASIGCWS